MQPSPDLFNVEPLQTVAEKPVTTEPARHPWPVGLGLARLGKRDYGTVRVSHYELLIDHYREPMAIHPENTPGVATMWLELEKADARFVTLYVERGVYYAQATKAGVQAARTYFKLRPYNHRPKGRDLTKLRRNFNKFVLHETDWEPMKDNQQFRKACLANLDFRQRWAPNKDFNSYMP
jgi:hypothetical protein